jgi:hypothetical protein
VKGKTISGSPSDAFMHQDGDGFNVILQTLPLPNGDHQCKIVLRPP